MDGETLYSDTNLTTFWLYSFMRHCAAPPFSSISTTFRSVQCLTHSQRVILRISFTTFWSYRRFHPAPTSLWTLYFFILPQFYFCRSVLSVPFSIVPLCSVNFPFSLLILSSATFVIYFPFLCAWWHSVLEAMKTGQWVSDWNRQSDRHVSPCHPIVQHIKHYINGLDIRHFATMCLAGIPKKSAKFVPDACATPPWAAGIIRGGTEVGTARLTLYVISKVLRVHTFDFWKRLKTNDSFATVWIICVTPQSRRGPEILPSLSRFSVLSTVSI